MLQPCNGVMQSLPDAITNVWLDSNPSQQTHEDRQGVGLTTPGASLQGQANTSAIHIILSSLAWDPNVSSPETTCPRQEAVVSRGLGSWQSLRGNLWRHMRLAGANMPSLALDPRQAPLCCSKVRKKLHQSQGEPFWDPTPPLAPWHLPATAEQLCADLAVL